MTDYDNNLLRQAIIHAKAGEYEIARRYLERAIDLADDRETRVQSNYWMSLVVTDPTEKRKFLEETLAYEPTHPEARRELAILDGKLKPEEIVNPDALPAQSTETQAAKADRFTCPKCGGRMVFTPDGRSLFCEFCTRNQTLDSTSTQFEQDFILTMATGKGHRTPLAVKTFFCQGCGAQFVLPPQEISASCSYCGSNHVTVGTKEMVAPDSIIPMGFNQRQAARYLVEWIQKRKIAPEGKVQAPRGLYAPLYTFDIMGNVPWSGYVYRDKQKVAVSGEKLVHFNDILVPGAPKLAGLLPKISAGFDTNSAPAYDSRYLSGWPAEFPQTSMSDASLEARQQAVHRTRGLIRNETGYISDLNYSTANLSILSFKLVLVPVWLTALPADGRDYRLIINGMMGNIYCELPPRGLMGWLNEMMGN
jgi:DNA-directed RNA polymerase subunit RPC12/RpoP